MIYLILTMKALKRFVNDKFTKEIINKIWKFIIDWRTSVSFFIAWMITNGCSYCFFFIGSLLKEGGRKEQVSMGTIYKKQQKTQDASQGTGIYINGLQTTKTTH